ncbi:GNAT family N-acetyltransferase [Eubacteriales bacterium OttesenSCG-928-A19]|nr:GNAT family N-acetyltransferase [Eubacteriales bacterium OttesenSCG-928-A19]
MPFIDITPDNIAKEHICCAITEKKGESCVADKKAWLSQRFADGLVFKRLDARGKVFIEYIPAERAWCPIDAPGCMHIDCFWVAGQYKGKGHGAGLLAACVEDAREKGKLGITVATTKKKRPFMTDGRFFKAKGFEVVDTAMPDFELLYLPLVPDAPRPHFRDSCKEGRVYVPGLAIFYTNQCPFAHTYARRVEEAARACGTSITVTQFETAEEAQNAPSPFTTYSFFDEGVFITNEILSPGKLLTYLEAKTRREHAIDK